jgi:uncharacterized membrane protein YgdD (TMEM256/DUF423 family)
MSKWLFKLGALNAGASVITQAIGGHKPWEVDRKLIFQKAFDLHMSSAIGMMLCSLKPGKFVMVPGVLLMTGSVLFSGFAYYRCFTNDRKFNYFMPAGGSCIIFGWILLALA